jgi:hypothetical protein
MELGTTDIERARKIWLLGHSYPEAWVHVLNEPLDPRHPTRHNIWTPVLDRLQERVYSNGNHRRLDIGACHISNAAAKQAEKSPPDWDWSGQSIPERIRQLRSNVANFRPPILITFGANAYRFAQEALDFPTPSKRELEAKGLRHFALQPAKGECPSAASRLCSAERMADSRKGLCRRSNCQLLRLRRKPTRRHPYKIWHGLACLVQIETCYPSAYRLKPERSE